MQAAGNDFIVFDCMQKVEDKKISTETIVKLCHRNFGVGADGIIILNKGKNSADCLWQFYNCDGSMAEMCGNGFRCAILFLKEKYFPEKESIAIETVNGILKGKKIDQNLVEVEMPITSPKEILYEDKIFKLDGEMIHSYFLNTGVPHAVIEVKKLSKYPIEKVGKYLVKNPVFAQGTNVTFFERVEGNKILSTTFERGVEKETLACGTGVSAAAIVFSQLYDQNFPIDVKAPGGLLTVDCEKNRVTLKGAAEFVFEGDYSNEI
jgi:diaminopimelate epimerase